MKRLCFLLVLLLLPISLGTAEIEKWQRAPADITVGVLPLQWIYNGNAFTTPELVKQLAKEGEICKVFGHFWVEEEGLFIEQGIDEPTGLATSTIYTKRRTCKLCGKQEYYISSWEDIK